MSKMKRTLLVSCAVILLCMTIVVGMTYSLFSDRVAVRNHLKAGNLNIELWRTNLDYSVLNTTTGYMDEINVADDVNFTSSTEENVFGLDAKGISIAPGSYFDADMEIRNNGNVAFTYSFSIVLVGESNKLAEQLLVTVCDADGNEIISKELSGFETSIKIFDGEMAADAAVEKFSVRVDFIDDVEANKDLEEGETAMDNDQAKSQTAVFDLVAEAVQATKKG